MSESKKLVDAEYKTLRLEYLRHQPVCEIGLSGCTRKATEIHHPSRDAADYLNTDLFWATCRNCHVKAEAMPAEERKKLGLLI